MRCGGSGKIQEKVQRYATYPMIRTIDCAGCEDCRCSKCRGKGRIAPHGVQIRCPTCNGTGRKVSDER